MKKLLAICLVAVLCLGLVACSADPQTEQPIVDPDKPQPMAEAFVASLLKAEYDSALALMRLPENAVVSAEDIAWYLPRSSFNVLANVAYEYEISSTLQNKTETTQRFTVTATEANAENEAAARKEEVSVSVCLDDNNRWCVNAGEFYYTDWSFRTAGGNVKVSVNGRDLTENYISNKKAGPMALAYEYTLPYISKKDATVKLTCDNYVYEETVSPGSNTDPDELTTIYKPLEGDEGDAVLAYIKSTWNALCESYTPDVQTSVFQAYLSPGADLENAQVIKKGFQSLLGDHTNNTKDTRGNINYLLTKCLQSEKDKSFWVTDTMVRVNFKYELTWLYNLAKWEQSTRRYSSIVLAKETAGYKIHTITDNALFSYANEYTNEW